MVCRHTGVQGAEEAAEHNDIAAEIIKVKSQRTPSALIAYKAKLTAQRTNFCALK